MTIDIEGAMERHARIGLQFSGGRDSTAALYMLRPYWPRITVYHINPGHMFPELAGVVNAVERDLVAAGKVLVRVPSSVEAVWDRIGMPSDLVPFDNTPFGRMLGGSPLKISSRFDCCAATFMAPMHERMARDRITLVVRGQRDAEYKAPPLRSGDQASGIEFLYPLQSWSGDEVLDYLRHHGLPVAPFYERGMDHSPECMLCTAWWDEGRLDYLRKHHPAQHIQLRGRLKVINDAITKQHQALVRQLENEVN